MTTQQYLERARRAHDAGDRVAEDEYLMLAQQANTPPEAEEMAQGAERIRTFAQIVAGVLLIAAIVILVKWF